MPSFDIVSELNSHECANAVDQANRELAQRFDFKDSGATFALQDAVISLEAPAEYQLKQMLDILTTRLAKRGLDPKCMEVEDAHSNLARARQQVTLRHGIDGESGRKITRLIKDAKLKVQATIQGDKVRVTGKKRDDLQEAIQLLRKTDFDRPLQFENFRD
ncbi:MAG: YajQ family cyclic di-GMP-binding protein [Pseudomonadales bacterium]|nr:YajQ family cyclic di-GMP-binding protein [Pseudomonadales bacterium]